MYVKRLLQSIIEQNFRDQSRVGLLLPGIVGCGKTTMIEKILNDLSDIYDSFVFTGDDIAFRSAVALDSRYLLDYVQARTEKRALIFVDEVQKEEMIFDAVKIAYDSGNINFIISGSNPFFIKTKASQRLQRRGTLMEMHPFTMPEILLAEGLISESTWLETQEFMRTLLFERSHLPDEKQLPKVSVSQKMLKLAQTYLVRGGIPLSWQSPTVVKAMGEIKKVFERGFEPILSDTTHVSNLVAEALAVTHSREFTYQGVMQRSRLRQRRPIVEAINALIAHGYVTAKSPWLPDTDHRTYLTTFSYCDPGIVSYLNGSLSLEPSEYGPRIEGVCHWRLLQILALWPLKSHLDYYKPYTVTGSNIRFSGGEIDFILRVGRRVIPLEVKSAATVAASELKLLQKFMDERNLPFGVVLYGGRPRIDKNQRLIYWPWFLL